MVHDEIVKSKRFQADNVSEFNTREHEANYNYKENETDDLIVSKKVSDVYRTFSEKTQTNIVEIEQGPKLTLAVSPLPQRRHKSWVCKEGKWKHESFHEIVDDVIDIVTDNNSAISTDSQD